MKRKRDTLFDKIDYELNWETILDFSDLTKKEQRKWEEETRHFLSKVAAPRLRFSSASRLSVAKKA